MSNSKSFNSNVKKAAQSNLYLKRQRLHKLLESAVNYPMVAVYAGSGYGKTRAVYSFSQEFTAYTTWIQLSEHDNDAARFWEKYVHMISRNWPGIGKLLEEIGFPESDEAFSKYLIARGEMFSDGKKLLVVYDDFHLLHNPVILSFFERAVINLPQNGTAITISRTVPKINVNNMMMQESIFTISEDELCFTEDEVAEYFSQLALTATRQDIREILNDTRGWAFAVYLIGSSLSKNVRNTQYARAALKENIFKLIESEISRIKDKPVWQFLLRISLIDHFSADLVELLANDNNLIKQLDMLSAYIRFDHHLGIYVIHDLFIDYLRQFHCMIPDAEKTAIYNSAGSWCENNKYPAYALVYYEKARNYDAIIDIVRMFDLDVSQDIARCAMEIFDRIPDYAALQNPSFPVMDIKIKIILRLLGEASASAEHYAKVYKERAESLENNRALAGIYSAWAALRLMMSSDTNTYDFDVYFEQMRKYYEMALCETAGMIPNRLVGSYVLKVGTGHAEAPIEYIEALKRSMPHCVYALKGSMYGIDDLANGELYFLRRNLNSAEQYLSQALEKARAVGHHDIQSRALLYLMFVAFSRGKIDEATRFLVQSEALLEESEFAARYEVIDITRAFFNLTLNQPEQISQWLKSDFTGRAHPAFIDSFANQAKALYRYQTGQYNTLLAFVENERERQTLLLGKIELSILEALSLYKLGRKPEAFAALTAAYVLAEPNDIIMLFTRHAKDMRTLSHAAISDAARTIPKAWLESINRISSSFSKRLTYMISMREAENDDERKAGLTDREIKVLHDLSQGLSRTEIAASQNISVNTVKVVIQSIYSKLCVSGLHSAIRIATLRKLI